MKLTSAAIVGKKMFMKNSLYRFVKLYIGIDYLTQVFTINEKILKFSSSKVSLKYMFHGN